MMAVVSLITADLMFNSTLQDINGLKHAWLNNPARAWNTDDLISWAKRQQLRDMVRTFDEHKYV